MICDRAEAPPARSVAIMHERNTTSSVAGPCQRRTHDDNIPPQLQLRAVVPPRAIERIHV